MRILLPQLNYTVGDLKGNKEKIIQAIRRGQEGGAELVVFSELAICGYPPGDLVLLPHFIDAIEEAMHEIIQATEGIAAVVGTPRKNPLREGKSLYNSAAVIHNQKLLGYADKILLPTYDVFDERRYFEPGEEPGIWELHGVRFGITICEDLWQSSGLLFSTHYRRDPILEMMPYSPELLLNLSASPYSLNKFHIRLQVCLDAARKLHCPMLLCNQVGGNDSLIFDGYSFFIDMQGNLCCAKGFEEADLWINHTASTPSVVPKPDRTQDLYKALVLGVRDYFFKSGFKTACLGLSGGIDSALVACIAAEALGAQNILALYMPSRYSAPESGRDALLLAETLGMPYKDVPIERLFGDFLEVLKPEFLNIPSDATEENLQARIRGMILMAFSNKFGRIVLSTANKSEMALGYSTLYGDMCGGLGVISDLTKEQVYDLARWVNREREIIPKYIIERAPSAELKENQKDSDSLPEYSLIDRVVNAYVVTHEAPKDIAHKYHVPLELVEDLIKKIHCNEYKRRQAPPGLRVSEKAFSVGRRFPIVQKWA